MTMDPTPLAPVNPVAATATMRRSNRLLDIALAGAAVLAIGGVAFAIGRASAPAATAADFTRGGLVPGGAIVRPGGTFDPGAGGTNRSGFALNGGPSIDGTVTAIDGDSLTVKLADGQEMTFTLDGSTAYHEASNATSADVAVGDDVSVEVSGEGRVPVDGSGETPNLSASDVTVAR